MPENMGKTDRVIRIAVAILIAIAAFKVVPLSSGSVHWLALVVAVVLLGTGLLGFCPLYRPFGFNTCGRR